jgi:predicted metal-dependent hydrolase
VRDAKFALDATRAADWNGGSVLQSQVFNALSTFLPAGEAFFVATLKEVTDRAGGLPDGVTSREADWFARQESVHLRQHRDYNACIALRHPFLLGFLRYVDRSWVLVRALTTKQSRLALTATLEHVTSIFARLTLQGRTLHEDADCGFATLWRWHSLEELEHKSVVFDTYQGLGYPLRIRRIMMFSVLIIFATETAVLCALLMSHERRLGSKASWAELWRMLRSKTAGAAWRQYWAFFSRDFHPTDIDDSDLIAKWGADAGIRSFVRRSVAQ